MPSLEQTTNELKQFLAKELGITIEEFNTIYNISEYVSTVSDAKHMGNILIRANKVLTTMYAGIKSKIDNINKTQVQLQAKITKSLSNYIAEIKQKKHPLHLRDSIEADIKTVRDLHSEYETMLKERGGKPGKAPAFNPPNDLKALVGIQSVDEISFTTESIIDILGYEVDTNKMTAASIRSEAKRAAENQLSEQTKTLTSKQVAIDKLIAGIERESRIFASLVLIINTEAKNSFRFNQLNEKKSWGDADEDTGTDAQELS